MAIKKDKIGEWAFLIGVILAIVFGIIPAGGMTEILMLILVILGILVGFINIQAKETTRFLMAAIALLLAGTAGFGNLPWGVGEIVSAIVLNIGLFVAPAAVIVALRSVFKVGKD